MASTICLTNLATKQSDSANLVTRCPTNLILLQVELPHTKFPIGCLGLQCDKDVSILFSLFLLGGPVWVGGFLFILHNVAQHHNYLALELPDHPPKVFHSSLEWCLSGYVGIPMFVALDREICLNLFTCLSKVHQKSICKVLEYALCINLLQKQEEKHIFTQNLSCVL